MEILRDLPLEHIWLSQKAYIKKIAKLADHRRIYLTPMSSNELLPNEKHASPAEIQNYQRKIGLLLFAIIFTRPNIAFAISRLAKFLNNPSLHIIKQLIVRLCIYITHVNYPYALAAKTT
jgi:hypothetical protein